MTTVLWACEPEGVTPGPVVPDRGGGGPAAPIAGSPSTTPTPANNPTAAIAAADLPRVLGIYGGWELQGAGIRQTLFFQFRVGVLDSANFIHETLRVSGAKEEHQSTVGKVELTTKRMSFAPWQQNCAEHFTGDYEFEIVGSQLILIGPKGRLTFVPVPDDHVPSGKEKVPGCFQGDVFTATTESMASGSPQGGTPSAAAGNSAGHAWCLRIGGKIGIEDPSRTGWNAMWAAGPDDIWFTGYRKHSSPYGSYTALTISHFDGSTFCVVEQVGVSDLYSLWGSSPNDIWFGGDGGKLRHWNGETLRYVEAPDFPTGDVCQITGRSPNEVYAVACDGIDDQNMVLRWDGAKWKRVPYMPSMDQFGSRDEPLRIWVDSIGRLWATTYPHPKTYCDVYFLPADGKAWQCGLRADDLPNRIPDFIVGHGPEPTVIYQVSERYGYDPTESHAVTWSGTWNRKKLPGRVSDLRVLSASEMWATGRDGTWRFDGSTWHNVSRDQPLDGPRENINRLGGTDSAHLWAIGGTNVISVSPINHDDEAGYYLLRWTGSGWAGISGGT